MYHGPYTGSNGSTSRERATRSRAGHAKSPGTHPGPAGLPNGRTEAWICKSEVKILVVAACVVGVIGVGGAAFTATGITDNAPSAAFIGGTVSQSITGAALSNIGYGFADTANTEMNSVTLTFADATNGATPTVAVSPADGSVTWSCEAVGAAPPPDVSTCTASGTPAYQTGVTGIAVTVPTSG